MSSYAQTVSTPVDRGLVAQHSEAERVVFESLERSAVTLDEYATMLIRYSQGAQEVARRTLASRRRAILRDAWGDLLKAVLRNWLRPETYSEVVGAQEDQADVSRNPAKDIWTELSVLYKKPPVRTGEGVEKYQTLTRNTHFNLFWQRVELYLEAFNDLLIWPTVVIRHGKKVIRHRIATPDMVTLKTLDDDPTEVEGLVIIDAARDFAGGDRTRYQFWTNEWQAVFAEAPTFETDDRGRATTVRELERADIGPKPGENPYGELPFVAIHRDPVESDFWNSAAGEDLVCLTLLIGRNRTCDHYARKMSGFTQLLQWGEAPEEPRQQLRHEAAVMQFVTGGNGGVKEVTWAANLDERANLNDRDIAAAAAARGINAEKLKAGPTYQNTTSARLSERGLSERREAKVETFVVAEQEYYRAVCLVAKANGLDAPDRDAEFEIEHSPMEYPDDPATLAQSMRENVAIGLESVVTLMRRLHPTWSEEKCLAEVKKRMDETSQVMEIKTKRNVADDLTNRSASDEANGAQGPVIRDGADPLARYRSPPPGSPAGKPQQQGEGVEAREEKA